mgnify:CR=1 FL=1
MYRKEQTVLLHCIMINMQQGRIIKIISNQYTIQNEKEEIIAKPRGKNAPATNACCRGFCRI